MSQYLVAIWNETARDISISNTESDNAAKIPAGQAVIVQGRHGHWNIPDCSADKYFKDHHMAIQEVGGTILYCFWGDDSANYLLQFCRKASYADRQTMPGASSLGNQKDVLIRVTDSGLIAVHAVVAGS